MNNRTLGTLPISVGTSIAIEGLANAPMHRYQSFLINIRTIVRNAREAFDELPNEDDLFEAAKEDMIQIATAIAGMKLKTILDMKFYYPTYNSLPRLFPMAKLKPTDPSKMLLPREQNLKIRTILDNKVYRKLLSEFNKLIVQIDSYLPQFGGDGLIITHHPVDLVLTESYHRLHLLESHTGTIKNYTMLTTKLTGGDTMPNMPLNKLTIQIFGDKAVNFLSQNQGVKKEIKELANSVPWSSASTHSFVAMSIRKLKASPEKDILIKMI
ncbi:hypothetical protein PQC07_gp219 [Aeromonas phage D3]|uniref:Uncharacterized protein n=3 Tax=Ludhianavirus TaxID=3044751 RepID=A0A514A1E5_9CAUD|nr:hypothetical protein PQC06_gp221 [Aeromonas phage LAh10]YP_010668537.1 hypothetical protein PQC07_gp219 [Aeromonas phage D3]YP_010668802.1 hypothetical protein PQC08_gp221 [Aeromonas phage D6]QEP52359.1 unclassified head-tail protein [Aeromonas phage D9]QDH47103.1 hypothetical protein LAh10_220 [Aeromonas phage LAh10]QDJ97053.1 hypothetical protein D3_0056 [Aeromonas phage D3]QDJ97214.1 hypothetical protein D6_0054 [Aeromonas phage D6]